MSKRTQEESSEERVTAKSRPMLSLIARARSTLSSSASESPGKRSYESQSPLSLQAEKYDGKGGTRCWPWHKLRARAPQAFRSTDTAIHHWGRRNRIRFVVRIQMILGWGEWSSAEKTKKRSSMNVTEDGENILWYGECSCLYHWKHLYSWRRINQTIGIPSRTQTKDFTMKQMFDISAKLVSEQDWDLWSVNNWLGKLFMEVFVFDWWWTSHQSSAHKCPRVFRFCIVSWWDTPKLPIKHCMGTKIGVVQKYTGIQNLRQNWWWVNGIRFNTLQLSQEVKGLLLRFNETPENFTRKNIFMSMFNDISWRSRDNKIECESNAKLVALVARRFGAGQWSFLGPGSEKKVVRQKWCSVQWR